MRGDTVDQQNTFATAPFNALPQIESHVEAWDVSATQALLLLLRPSERAAWRRWGRRQQEATEQ